jgi:hypothetical protein
LSAFTPGRVEGHHVGGSQADANLPRSEALRRGEPEAEFVIEHRKRMEKNSRRREKEPGYEFRKIETPAEAEPQPA